MHKHKHKHTIALLLGLTGGAVQALPGDEQNTAALVCAEALAERQGQHSYELLHVASRPGRGNFRFWLNGNDGPAAGYCETRRGELAQLSLRSTPWSRSTARVPETLTLGAVD